MKTLLPTLAAVFLLRLLAPLAVAQIAEAWSEEFDGPAMLDDAGNNVFVDANGDVIVKASTVDAEFNAKAYVVKYSGVDGTVVWQKFLAPMTARGLDASGALLLHTNSTMVKLAGSDGSTVWEKPHISGAGAIAPSGDVYFASSTVLERYAAATGDLVWSAAFTGLIESSVAIDFDPVGNLYIARRSNTGRQTRVEKRSKDNGALQSGREIGADGFQNSGLGALPIWIDTDQAGNVYAYSEVTEFDQFDVHPGNYYRRGLVKKLSPDGALRWERGVGQSNRLAAGPDGSTALSTSNHRLSRLNPDGTIAWSQINPAMTIVAIDVDAGGNVVVTGTTGASGFINITTKKFASADGALLWEKTFNGSANHNDYVLGLALTPDNGAVVTGSTSDGATNNALTIKYVPPPAFEITTRPATNVGTVNAVVGARVTPVGGATTVTFEYGTDPQNLNLVATVPGTVPEGVLPVNVSTTLEGLTKGGTYHFRATATNTGGTVMGEALQFTTNLTSLTAMDDVIFVPGRQVTFSPQDNDLNSDHPASSLQVTVLAQPTDDVGTPVGTVAAVPGSTALSFQAADTFVSRATFDYAVEDPSGTVDEATVTLVRFGAISGTFQGVLSGASGGGAITITVNGTSGSLTGNFLFNGTRFTIDGRLDTRGVYLDVLGDTGMTLMLQIDANGAASGTVRDSLQDVVATGLLDRLDGGGTGFQPATGLYTTFLDIDAPTAANGAAFSGLAASSSTRGVDLSKPGGSGFLSVTVSKTKKRPARFVGALPDSVKFSAGSQGLAGRRYSIAQQLYKAGKKDFRGSIFGQPAFPENVNDRLDALMDWRKNERPGDPLYPGGFGTLKLLLNAGRYIKTTNPIEFPQNIAAGLPNMRIDFKSGGLASTLFSTMRVDGRSSRTTLIADESGIKPKVKISRSPVFKGSFVPPGEIKPVKFVGVFRQGGIGGESAGQGTFVATQSDGTKVTGKVRVTVIR